MVVPRLAAVGGSGGGASNGGGPLELPPLNGHLLYMAGSAAAAASHASGCGRARLTNPETVNDKLSTNLLMN
jgi:hypothetical protein